MEKFYNVSDNRTKRVHLRFVLGLDSEGYFAYTPPYDLMDSKHIDLLMNISKNGLLNRDKGFVIEESCFETDEYDPDGLGENEFRPLKYYLKGKALQNGFQFDGHNFGKSLLPIEMIEEPGELNKILATVIYDVQQTSSVEEIANMYREIPTTHKKEI